MDVKEFKTWKEQVAKLIEHGCIDINRMSLRLIF